MAWLLVLHFSLHFHWFRNSWRVSSRIRHTKTLQPSPTAFVRREPNMKTIFFNTRRDEWLVAASPCLSCCKVTCFVYLSRPKKKGCNALRISSHQNIFFLCLLHRSIKGSAQITFNGKSGAWACHSSKQQQRNNKLCIHFPPEWLPDVFRHDTSTQPLQYIVLVELFVGFLWTPNAMHLLSVFLYLSHFISMLFFPVYEWGSMELIYSCSRRVTGRAGRSSCSHKYLAHLLIHGLSLTSCLHTSWFL